MTSTTEEKIFDKALGDRLRKIRILKGYSQKDLSKEINVTFQQLQKYETGSNRISISRLFSIAKILNIEISTLINNEVEVINENHETLKMLISKK